MTKDDHRGWIKLFGTWAVWWYWPVILFWEWPRNWFVNTYILKLDDDED